MKEKSCLFKFYADLVGFRGVRFGKRLLKPKSFALGTTKQYIKLPLTTSARIEGRSKLGRLGVGIHVTAPTIHAGFEGTITLEIFNHSPRSVKLKPWVSLEEEGLRIGQLIFETVEGTVSQTQNTSTFRNQTGTLG
jgi:dCTP deaminase